MCEVKRFVVCVACGNKCRQEDSTTNNFFSYCPFCTKNNFNNWFTTKIKS